FGALLLPRFRRQRVVQTYGGGGPACQRGDRGRRMSGRHGGQGCRIYSSIGPADSPATVDGDRDNGLANPAGASPHARSRLGGRPGLESDGVARWRRSLAGPRLESVLFRSNHGPREGRLSTIGAL